MKQRFSSLDLQILAHELSSTLTGYRLANIYDLTSRIFLLKFAKPESKHLLVIDSGLRCHLTSFSRATATTPSSFVARLRKSLRTRRLTKCSQLGTDRVLELEFSDGFYRLFLEFYAGGNVILTDKEYTIIAVLRIVTAGEEGRGECKVGVKYDVSGKQNADPVTRENIVAVLQSWSEQQQEDKEEPQPSKGKKPGKFQQKQKKKKKGEDAIKRVLGAKMSEFSPMLIEHSFHLVGIDPDLRAQEVLASEELVDKVFSAFKEAEKTVKGILESEIIKGYIIAKQPRESNVSFATDERPQKRAVTFGSSEAVEVEEQEQKEKVQEDGEAKGLVFTDFQPFFPKQFEGVVSVKVLEYDGFNKTVDTFFSSIESQKLESRLKEREVAAVKRLESARTDHKRRVEGLRNVQELNVQKAQAIEANLDRVEEAISAMNGLIAQGMDWVAMGRLIEVEKKRGNAVAELVKLPLKLFENTITLKLAEPSWNGEEDDDDDDDNSDEDGSINEAESSDNEDDKSKKPTKDQKYFEIDIDLSLTAWANATQYYVQKKSAAVKEEKTIQSSSKALKSTERKIQADLKKGLKQEKQVLRPVRQQLWFEKFLFFISSDGHLVLGGRDMQQREIIYKRYFKRGDVLVHADIEGAAAMIIKNNANTPDAPIPPSTLSQAGTLSVATSKAWDSKSILSAWWVNYDQVSKTAPSGDYLPAGNFMIRGKRNFLPPAQLVLGYGVMWMVDDESKAKHVKHRLEEQKDENLEEEAKSEKMLLEKEVGENEGEEEPSGEEDEEDSDEDEFPDAKIESEKESDEEFPDTKIEENNLESEDEEESSRPPAETITEKEKYAVEVVSNEESDTAPLEPGSSSRTDSPSTSKHLSAKERRVLKKARATGQLPLPNPSPTPSKQGQEKKPSTKQNQQNPPAQPPQVRGKRGKQKKAATKYANQDDEDRLLAMSLLGAGAAKAKAEQEAAAKALKEQEEILRQQRRREQHLKAEAQGRAQEKARRLENPAAADEDEEEEDAITPLDNFVGTPFVGDTILDAIPVCAPWGAMGKFKYKAKLQPGAQKKGKAVKQIVGKWIVDGEKRLDPESLDVEKMWPRERDLIKGWKETEIINCVGVSKVKVFGTAGSSGAGKGGKGGKGGRRK